MGKYTSFEGSAKKRQAVRREPTYTLADLSGLTGVSVVAIRTRIRAEQCEFSGIDAPEPCDSHFRTGKRYLLSVIKEWHNKWQERTGGKLL